MSGGAQTMQTLSFISPMYFSLLAISRLLCLLPISLQFLPAALPPKCQEGEPHSVPFSSSDSFRVAAGAALAELRARRGWVLPAPPASCPSPADGASPCLLQRDTSWAWGLDAAPRDQQGPQGPAGTTLAGCPQPLPPGALTPLSAHLLEASKKSQGKKSTEGLRVVPSWRDIWSPVPSVGADGLWRSTA